MPILAISIVFCLAWWVVFLAVLSVGVSTEVDSTKRVEGAMTGAPINPNLGKKALWATYGGVGFTFLFWLVVNLVQNTG